MVRFHPRLPFSTFSFLDFLAFDFFVPAHHHPPGRLHEIGAARHDRRRHRRVDIASPGAGRVRRDGERPRRRSDVSASGRRQGPDSHEQGSRGADGLSPQHGASAGGRGDAALPDGAVRHRSADRRRLLLRLRRREAVRAGRSRRDREEDEGDRGAATSSTSGRCGRATKRSGSSASAASRSRCSSSRRRRRARKTSRSTRSRTAICSSISASGPHVPTSGRLKAFKLLNTSNAYWKGDARNQPMQRIYGTAFFSDKELQAYLTQIEEAKKRDHRKVGRELGLFLFHPWAAGATFWLDKGHDALQPARELHARRAVAHRLRRSEDAARVQQGAVGNVGPLVALSRRTCSSSSITTRRARRARCRAARAQGDELPRAHAAVRERGAQLSRPAAALSRADAAASQRSVGHAVGAHARAAAQPGRCALFRRAGSQIGEEVERLLGLVQRVYADFGLQFESEAVDASAGVSRRGRDMGLTPRRSSSARSSRRRGLHAQRRRRRVLRAEDRLRRHRRDRPEVAVRDDSARLPDAGSGSA